MSICATLKVEPEKADAIQALFEFESGLSATLVEHTASIARHIAYIHGPDGESQAHLRPYVTNEAQWDKTFPTMARGRGSIDVIASSTEDQMRNSLAKLQFVLGHPELFIRATDLLELAEFFECDVGESFPHLQCKVSFPAHSSGMAWSRIVDGRPALEEPDPSFEQMPQEKGVLYHLALVHNAPYLWSKLVRFRASPSQEAWDDLRGALVPWSLGTGPHSDESDISTFIQASTIWQLVEAKYGMDNAFYTYRPEGRFNKSFPDFDFVENALLNAPLYRRVSLQVLNDFDFENARRMFRHGGKQ